MSATIHKVTGTNWLALCPWAFACKTQASDRPRVSIPPRYPKLQPQPETRPYALGIASSRKKAAVKVSQRLKARLDRASSATAIQSTELSTKAKPAVLSPQSRLAQKIIGRFPPRRSAHMPSEGSVSMVRSEAPETVRVQSNVAQGAAPAITPTK